MPGFTPRDWTDGELVDAADLENLETRLGAGSKGVCKHNGSAYPARPNFDSVEFIGPTDPGGLAENGDTWVPTA